LQKSIIELRGNNVEAAKQQLKQRIQEQQQDLDRIIAKQGQKVADTAGLDGEIVKERQTLTSMRAAYDASAKTCSENVAKQEKEINDLDNSEKEMKARLEKVLLAWTGSKSGLGNQILGVYQQFCDLQDLHNSHVDGVTKWGSYSTAFAPIPQDFDTGLRMLTGATGAETEKKLSPMPVLEALISWPIGSLHWIRSLPNTNRSSWTLVWVSKA